MQQHSLQTDDRLKRLEAGPLKREADTVLAMIRIYCRAHHALQGDALCGSCQELADYAMKRLACCPLRKESPSAPNARSIATSLRTEKRFPK